MRGKLLIGAAVLGAVCFVAGTTDAGPFDPAFRVTRITGPCQVMAPGTAGFTDAEDGKAYAFGTEVASGDGGTFAVALSMLSETVAGAKTRLSVVDSKGEKPQRAINLLSGRIDVELENEYEQANALDVVTHCSTISALKGGKFSVEVKSEEDLVVSVVANVTTELKITGPQFTIAKLDKEQGISIACAQDRGLIRIRAVSGQYPITVLDSDGNPKEISMEPGSVVKIFQKKSETGDTIVVTILAIDSNGAIVESFTYETKTTAEGLPLEAPGATATTQPGVTPTTQAGAREPLSGEWSSTTTTTTSTTTVPRPEARTITAAPITTTSTTTTTRPSPTPVGKR